QRFCRHGGKVKHEDSFSAALSCRNSFFRNGGRPSAHRRSNDGIHLPTGRTPHPSPSSLVLYPPSPAGVSLLTSDSAPAQDRSPKRVGISALARSLRCEYRRAG